MGCFKLRKVMSMETPKNADVHETSLHMVIWRWKETYHCEHIVNKSHEDEAGLLPQQ